MAIFQNVLLMLVAACVLLQLSRRLNVPYPSMLALAGVGVGLLPGMGEVALDPQLMLALFIAPALMDSAFDTAPRELRRNWLPLVSLVLVAVVLTTAAVAWAGVAMAGLPLAAAVTLGAIVAPPDAVAAGAVMQQFHVPRRTLSIINGESLLNDAVALLLFGLGVSIASSSHDNPMQELPLLLAAVPGGAVLGMVTGWLTLRIARWFSGTRSAIVFQFVMTFATWITAEHWHLSPIIAVVALGMTVARRAPERNTVPDRVHANVVWGTVVFVLNVLAFLLMGLQARMILSELSGNELWRALRFAGTVFGLVVFVRLAWVMLYGIVLRMLRKGFGVREKEIAVPTLGIGLLVGWSGMRGMVTLATAFALPARFPGRDLIVLSAFAVVLGTLVLQGFTIGPLIRLLKIRPDTSFDEELARTRTAMLDAAAEALADKQGAAAEAVRTEYRTEADATRAPGKLQPVTEYDSLRLAGIRAQRKVLAAEREAGSIGDDVFHRLEEELDLEELAASDSDDFRLTSA